MPILVNYDELTGVETWLEVADGKATYQTRQNIAPILEQNKELFNDEGYKKRGIKSGFYHAARIPEAVVLKWMQEGVNIFDKNATKAIERKLNDPEYRYLRTSSGRI
jgi:hypothetical protein